MDRVLEIKPYGKKLQVLLESGNKYIVRKKDVHDFLAEKDKVKVKVVAIDEKGKIGLSIKQLQEKKAEESTEAPARERSSFRAPRNNFGGRDFRKPNRYSATSASFEDKLSKFLKDSDERLTDLRRKTDSKRGGRGSRRD